MEQSTLSIPALRTHGSYRAPCRKTWAKANAEPYPVFMFLPVAGAERINAVRADRRYKASSKAEAAIRKDLSTMEAHGAAKAWSELYSVCEGVRLEHGIEDPVFFDPETQNFWVYPEADAGNP